MYNVFDTESEANTAQEIDFQLWKTNAMLTCNCPKYWETTTAWATPQQRTDGKWVYPLCPEGDQTHSQEELQDDWFPTEP